MTGEAHRSERGSRPTRGVRGAAWAAAAWGAACAAEALAAALAPAPGPAVTAGELVAALLVGGALAGLIGWLTRGAAIVSGAIAAAVGWRALALVGAGPVAAVGGLAVAALATRSRAGAVLAVAGVAMLGPALTPRPGQAGASAGAEGRDVVLITVDTVRADAGLTPGPGAWRTYEAAIAPATWTLPSMDSLMRGMAVRDHGGGVPVDGEFTRPDPALPMLAEQLRARGYATAAFVCNPHLRAVMDFDRGFQHFDHADAWREPLSAVAWADALRVRWTGALPRLRHERDAWLAHHAADWLARTEGEGPRLLWVHLLLPHEYTRDAWRPPPGWFPGDEDPERKRLAYAGNIDATSALLRELVAAIPDDAVVAITSDHGESLGEAGMWGHGRAFVDEQLRVPLWLRGVPPGRVGVQVALADLAAVLLDPAALSRLDAGHAELEVGGIRRDAGAWAARLPDGSVLPRLPPDQIGKPRPMSDAMRAALRELGYVDGDAGASPGG